MRSINLLPPEVHQKRLERQQLTKWLLRGLGYVALLTILGLMYQTRVSQAERQAVDEEMLAAGLEAQLSQFDGVDEVVVEYDMNVALVEAALAQDLSWGRLLNDLGRVIPDAVWLESFRGDRAADPSSTSLGAIQVTGVGFAYPDVSAWLRAIDSDSFPAATGTWVTNVTESGIGGAPVVRFVSSASLTEGSRSRRVDARIPRIGR